MNEGTRTVTISDARLTQVLEDYLAAVQAGTAPDKQALLARHPDLADELRACLDTLDFIRQAGVRPPPAEGDTGDPEANGLPKRELGDYRIICEVGRGGMGIVYEAEQLSLGRRVALKVLPFVGVLDNRQLRRFENEAHAAAQLHHANILPVHGIGCERGVHFYAMQFVDGPTLADVIRELRGTGRSEKCEVRSESGGEPGTEQGSRNRGAEGCLAATRRGARTQDQGIEAADGLEDATTQGRGPGSSAIGLPMSAALSTLSADGSARSPAFFRSVASLGTQAAEALEHAHEMGVIHRDIKPSNLLLDADGKLWVTDFGLALCQTDPGQTLTMAGDLVGTIRYMSPEQAQGGPTLIDHRTDVYSLGVTLYELLTLQPAFTGRDRQELLRKIADEEPRRPRQLNDAIPADLQTIVLKATQKEPQDRYATAQALAHDLKHFLEDKPILAKPPSLIDRATKWARRHRAVVASAVVVLAIAVVALTVTLVATRSAYESETRQRQRAEENFGRALEAVDLMLTQVAEQDLADLPYMHEVRRKLLEGALSFYQGFLDQQGETAGLRFETASAHSRTGKIYELLGQHARAEAAYVQAIGMFESLASDSPDIADYRRSLARCHTEVGLVLTNVGRSTDVAEHHAAAVALRESLIRNFAASSSDWGAYLHAAAHLGWVQQNLSRSEEAEDTFRHALSLRQELAPELPRGPADLSGEALLHLYHAEMLMACRRTEKALEAFRRSSAIGEQVATAFPDQREARLRLVQCRQELAEALTSLGRQGEAEDAFRQGIAAGERLVADFPAHPEHASQLSWMFAGFSDVLTTQDRPDEAEEAIREAIRIRERLTQLFPAATQYRRYLADAWDYLGRLCHLHDSRDEAAEAFANARAHYDTLLNEYEPTARARYWFAQFLFFCPDPQFRDGPLAVTLAERLVQDEPEVAYYWQTLGGAYYRVDRWANAIDALTKAMELRAAPQSIEWFLLAMAHWRLDDAQQARVCFAKGTAAFGKGSDIREWYQTDILLVRDEAAALLGIDEESTTHDAAPEK